MATKQFQVGEIYFGTLSCAHGDFPVKVTKRTAKTVWFEHAVRPDSYKPTRSRVREVGNYNGETYEACNFHGWSIWSDKQEGGDFDPMTI